MKLKNIARCSFLFLALAAIWLLAASGARAQTFTVLATFDGADGVNSQGVLTLSADGTTFYGTTDTGGADNYGVVFSVPVAGGASTTLYSFTGGTDGQYPVAGVTLSADGKTLYGTTLEGGAHNYGVVFSVPVAGGASTTLHSFTYSGNEGGGPFAGVTLSADGLTLYGTTKAGGAANGGTVFSIPAAGDAVTTLYSFTGTGNDGADPYASLTLSADGTTFYGTTESGGAANVGTVFSVPVGGGASTTLYSFTGTGLDGANPYGGVTLSADGSTLYGTTLNGGGAADSGVVFSVPSAGGVSKTLYSFTGIGNDGAYPYAGVTLSSDGKALYGTTEYNGAYGYGVVFSVPAAGGVSTTLHSFTGGTDGGSPFGGLTLSSDGNTVYGTTQIGGAGGGTLFSLTPLKATTTTTNVDCSPNPSTYGGAVTIVATITPKVPNGETVTFYDGATPIGTAKTLAGIATLTTKTLPVGSDSITASYPGDANFASSTSSAVIQVVNQAATTTGIKSSPNPSSYEGSVTFTAWVRPIPPYGETVTFYDGGASIGTGTTLAGNATFTTSTLAFASHSITASYPGDSNLETSTSSALSQNVLIARPTTVLTSSANPSPFGASVTFTATISPLVPNGETVIFYDGAVSKAVIGSSSTTGGVATLTTSALAGGIHTLWAQYVGDSNHTYSWSGPLSQTIDNTPRTTSIKSSLDPSNYNSSVTFTAWVRPIPANGETVTFYDGAASIGTGTTSGGNATFTSTSLGAGSHNITVGYAGDSIYAGSTSSVLTQNVSVIHPTTTLVSSLNPSPHGIAVKFTATVSPSVPDGETVNFYEGASSKALIGTGTTLGGVATLTISTLATGSQAISAEYVGDANYAYSWSNSVAQTVN